MPSDDVDHHESLALTGLEFDMAKLSLEAQNGHLREKVHELQTELLDEKAHEQSLRREQVVQAKQIREEERSRAHAMLSDARQKLYKEKQQEVHELQERLLKEKEKEIAHVSRIKDEEFRKAQLNWSREKDNLVQKLQIQFTNKVGNDSLLHIPHCDPFISCSILRCKTFKVMLFHKLFSIRYSSLFFLHNWRLNLIYMPTILLPTFSLYVPPYLALYLDHIALPRNCHLYLDSGGSAEEL